MFFKKNKYENRCAKLCQCGEAIAEKWCERQGSEMSTGDMSHWLLREDDGKALEFF